MHIDGCRCRRLSKYMCKSTNLHSNNLQIWLCLAILRFHWCWHLQSLFCGRKLCSCSRPGIEYSTHEWHWCFMALGLPRWNFKQDQREDTQDHWVYPFHFCPGINSLLGPWIMCLGAGHASDSQVSYQYPNIHLDRNKITDLRKHREKYDCGDKSKTHCDPFVISISPPFRYPVGIP